MLISINLDLASIYSDEVPLSVMVSDNLTFPYYEEIIEFLRPWSGCFDVSITGHVDSLDKDQIGDILPLFSQTDGCLGQINSHRNHMDRAENHCQSALSYARLFEGKEKQKTKFLCRALRGLYELRVNQGNYTDALMFAKEAYNCNAVAYNPVHPKVQRLLVCSLNVSSLSAISIVLRLLLR